MSSCDEELLSAFDGHEVESVRGALEQGANPCEPIRGKSPVDWLLQEYTRSDRLGDCLACFRARHLRDPAVAPVFLNDADATKAAISQIRPCYNTGRRWFLHLRRSTTFPCFTWQPNWQRQCGSALIEAGADVNARADVDEYGLNGHTPLFHTVNSIHNRSEPIMRLLLAAGARTDIQLAGITWGKGYEWETTFFDVTPISYAQMGLLPQVHRNEDEIYSNLRSLLEASGRTVPPLTNVPNRYLRPKSRS